MLDIHFILLIIQRIVSLCGILIIISGVASALYHYSVYLIRNDNFEAGLKMNDIRLYLSRTLILGLEFIVAADLIGTTTTPDYYTVGLLAIIVAIRTLLSYSINREIILLSKEK